MANQDGNFLPSPHFLRVILTEDHARLKLPPQFLKRYGNTLSKKGFLKAVNSPMTWEVEISRSREGRVWLTKGWKEFAEHYSIKFRHLLMFEYEGNSRFTVSIFGADTMEVQYPAEDARNDHNAKSKAGEEEPEEMDDSHDDDDDEKEDYDGGHDDDDDADEEDYNGGHDNDDDVDEEDYDGGHDDDDDDDDDEEEEDYDDGYDDDDNNDDEDNHMPSPKGKSRKANTSSRNVNPCFRVKMKKINVMHHKPSMLIPQPHADEYLLGQKNRIIYLRVKEDGNVASDSLECKYYIERSQRRQRRLSVSTWLHFVIENRLQVDDICVFELVQRNVMLYDVSILRA